MLRIENLTIQLYKPLLRSAMKPGSCATAESTHLPQLVLSP